MKKQLKKIMPDTILQRSRRWRAFHKWLLMKTTQHFSPRPRLRKDFCSGSILVIAPHIDDEIIGAGGTLLSSVAAGATIEILYVFSHNDQVRKKEAALVKEQAGFSSISFLDWSDTEPPSAIQQFSPEKPAAAWDEIYLPHPHDNHPSHLRLGHNIRAWVTRLPTTTRLFLFEVWTPLVPSTIVDITDLLDKKLSLIKLFNSQLIDKDYIAASAGLAHYRALLLPRRDGAAECFLEVTPTEYLELLDAQ